MKTLNIALLTLGVAIEIMAIQDAAATDLLGRKHDEQYADPAGVNVNWSGFYVGGRLGYGNANHDLTLQDYFKDYCDDFGIVSGGGDKFGSQRFATVENYNNFFNRNSGDDYFRLSCDQQLLPDGKGGNVQTDIGIDTVSGDTRDVANVDGINSHGVIGGGQIGYDQQVYNWVIGIFGSYNFSAMETTANFKGFSAKIEKDDEWTVGVRAGHLLGERTMLYGLAGYTQADYDFTVSPDVEGLRNNVTFDGVTFGAGLEHAVTQNVFLGIEGTHTTYGEETIFDNYVEADNVGTKVTDDLSETRVMGTLKIKLNGY